MEGLFFEVFKGIFKKKDAGKLPERKHKMSTSKQKSPEYLRKTPVQHEAFLMFGIRRLPIFPGRHQPSIFGV